MGVQTCTIMTVVFGLNGYQPIKVLTRPPPQLFSTFHSSRISMETETVIFFLLEATKGLFMFFPIFPAFAQSQGLHLST